jgi:hypothetical protein
VSSHPPSCSDRENVSSIRVGTTEAATHLRLNILRIVFTIDITGGRFILEPKGYVADLGGQVVFEIQEASLTDVLALRTCLTNDCSFVPHARTWVPPKDSKTGLECSSIISNKADGEKTGSRSGACPASSTELLLSLTGGFKLGRVISPANANIYHSNKRIVSKT